MRIKCAAIKQKDGVIVEGLYHGECFKKAKGKGKGAIQGFMTDCGKFVDRIEGLKIATEANQIIKKYRPYDELLSEDYRIIPGH